MAKKKTDEDLFDDSTMTFGEHLEELRDCLIRSIYGLVIAVVIGFLVGNQVVRIIRTPLERALESYRRDISAEKADKLITEYQDKGQPLPYSPEEVQEGLQRDMLPQLWYVRPADLSAMVHQGTVTGQESSASATTATSTENPEIPESTSVTENLNHTGDDRAKGEGNTTVPGDRGNNGAAGKTDLSSDTSEVTSTGDGFLPLFLWMRVQDDPQTHASAFSFHEGFMIWMKASLLTGLTLASPWIFWQLWSFIAAGLYSHEKRYVRVYLPFSIGLFALGVLVAFFIAFPLVLSFLLRFNHSLGFEITPRISEWMSFVLFLPFGFGISFQLPLVMLFLNRIGVIQVQDYIAYWRVAVLVVFCLAGIVTPPDPYSMSLLALPLTGLYFGGIFLCRYMPRGQSLFDPPPEIESED
ncbi:MAG: twin-arginine translocase subunit TatC [Planctomycetia bacterium]|nr:twin-arginine translocase subunit TatC [Planctomycetia bacterium]